MNAPRVLHPDGAVHRSLEPASLDLVYGPEDVVNCRTGGGSRAGESGPALVSGPFDYWYLRHLREGIGVPSLNAADLVTTDLFLWSTEAATNRAATRLGGVPYMPRSSRWPTRHGVVGSFLGQLNFADSRDLVPFAPTDLLLVFTFEHDAFSPWERDDYAFVWVDVAATVPLHAATDVPVDGLLQRHELHGIRVRSCEEPSLVARIRSVDLPHVHVIRGTKIGGCPTDDQSIEPPEVPTGWRFLAQLVHQYPSNDVPFPVLDHPQPVTYLSPEFDALTGGRHGTTCLYLDEHGEVRLHFTCS